MDSIAYSGPSVTIQAVFVWGHVMSDENDYGWVSRICEYLPEHLPAFDQALTRELSYLGVTFDRYANEGQVTIRFRDDDGTPLGGYTFAAHTGEIGGFTDLPLPPDKLEKRMAISRKLQWALKHALYAVEVMTEGAAASAADDATVNGRKGGRPRNPENDWAYKQVRELGRPPEEVYQEWFTKIGDRAETLSDPRDSFNKAIKRK